jgi:hypothetical protein
VQALELVVRQRRLANRMKRVRPGDPALPGLQPVTQVVTRWWWDEPGLTDPAVLRADEHLCCPHMAGPGRVGPRAADKHLLQVLEQRDRDRPFPDPAERSLSRADVVADLGH